MALDFLFNNGSPASVTGNVVSQQGMPDWYQEMLRGSAGKAIEVAGRPYQAYDGKRLASFNKDQNSAFDAVRNNQGNWQPALGSALSTAKGITGAAAPGLKQAGQYGTGAVNAAKSGSTLSNAYGSSAVRAVGGNAGQWTDPGTVNKYMSPYTKSVTDEIGRLGNRNLTENLIPATQSQFVGSGQFGSTRGMNAIGNTIRDAQADITGQQSMALQAGYGQAADIFGQDANRAQGQQQLQATTGLQAGNLANSNAQLGVNANLGSGALANNSAQIGSNAASTQAGVLGNLAQSQQQMAGVDAANLANIGGQQQALQQTGYDQAYGEFQNQQNYDWNNLNNINAVMRGYQIPTSSSISSNNPIGNQSQSPLGWVNSMYNLSQGKAHGGLVKAPYRRY